MFSLIWRAILIFLFCLAMILFAFALIYFAFALILFAFALILLAFALLVVFIYSVPCFMLMLLPWFDLPFVYKYFCWFYLHLLCLLCLCIWFFAQDLILVDWWCQFTHVYAFAFMTGYLWFLYVLCNLCCLVDWKWDGWMCLEQYLSITMIISTCCLMTYYQLFTKYLFINLNPILASIIIIIYILQNKHRWMRVGLTGRFDHIVCIGFFWK